MPNKNAAVAQHAKQTLLLHYMPNKKAAVAQHAKQTLLLRYMPNKNAAIAQHAHCAPDCTLLHHALFRNLFRDELVNQKYLRGGTLKFDRFRKRARTLNREFLYTKVASS